MKSLVFAGLISIVAFATQASDSAVCEVLYNGAKVKETVVLHQDYDVTLTGTYSYRTYARDEFYDLSYTYTTTSVPFSKKLTIELVGSENKFKSEVAQNNSFAGYGLETFVVDHENNKLSIKCNIL